MKIAIDWQLSSFFGWGVYGINLALEIAKRDVEALSTQVVRSDQVVVDKLRGNVLDGFIRRSNVQQPLPSDCVLLHALGNEFLPDHKTAKIGVVFFEEHLSPAAIERAKRYDIIITGSTWNEEVLRSHGLTNVRTLIQGVDRSLFHPAPRRNLYPGRFLIFSGGKAEPRKGQDIVVKAFRLFANRHPEAMLVTAWHSPWKHLAKGMDLDLSEYADRVIDIGQVPNGQMAPIYRECHVGLFPNRCEGGTNLVAMECVACGVPTILSNNTGHKDLLRFSFAYPLKSMADTDEPDIDDIIEALEAVFAGEGQDTGHMIPEWSQTADGLLAAAREVS